MNRHLRNRIHYHRHLVNTMSALSATAVMLVATLMVAAPAGSSAADSVASNGTTEASFSAAPAKHHIDARAGQLVAQLEATRNAGQALAHVAAFTAEVATVAALTAALDELPDSVETAEIAAPAAAKPTRSHKRTRQSLAMPYFSFASRS